MGVVCPVDCVAAPKSTQKHCNCYNFHKLLLLKKNPLNDHRLTQNSPPFRTPNQTPNTNLWVPCFSGAFSFFAIKSSYGLSQYSICCSLSASQSTPSFNSAGSASVCIPDIADVTSVPTGMSRKPSGKLGLFLNQHLSATRCLYVSLLVEHLAKLLPLSCVCPSCIVCGILRIVAPKSTQSAPHKSIVIVITFINYSFFKKFHLTAGN
jgi:hypothetical protein